MRIALGCDHAGFALKGPLIAALEAEGHDILDLGTFSDRAGRLSGLRARGGQAVLRGFVDAGVLVCGSGVGASIAANKIRGIRAALCHDLFTARQSREDDDANVLCLGARVLDEPTAVEVARAWLDARFSGEERHARRVAKIAQLEGRAPRRRTRAACPRHRGRRRLPPRPRRRLPRRPSPRRPRRPPQLQLRPPRPPLRPRPRPPAPRRRRPSRARLDRRPSDPTAPAAGRARAAPHRPARRGGRGADPSVNGRPRRDDMEPARREE